MRRTGTGSSRGCSAVSGAWLRRASSAPFRRHARPPARRLMKPGQATGRASKSAGAPHSPVACAHCRRESGARLAPLVASDGAARGFAPRRQDPASSLLLSNSPLCAARHRLRPLAPPASLAHNSRPLARLACACACANTYARARTHTHTGQSIPEGGIKGEPRPLTPPLTSGSSRLET